MSKKKPAEHVEPQVPVMPEPEDVTIGARESRDLPVALSDAEVMERGESLAKMLEEIVRLEAEMSAAKDDYKSRIKRKEAESDRLGQEIRNRARFVSIPCEWRYCWRENKKVLIRTDTGEIEDTLAIQDFERQLRIPVEPQGGEGGGGAA